MGAMVAFFVGLASLLCGLTISNADNSMDLKFKELQDQYKMVVNEVVDLRETMKLMKDDIKRVKRISRAFDALCKELHAEEENSHPDSGDKENVPQSQSDGQSIDREMPIHLSSVEKKGNTFQLEYTSSDKANVEVTNFGRMINDSFSDGSGHINVSSDSEGFWVSLEVQEYNTGVYLNTDNNDTTVAIPQLDMVTDVQDEVVFEPGKSSKVRVKLNKMKSESYMFNFEYGMFIKDRNKTETVVNTRKSFPGIINITEDKEYLNHGELTLIINENQEDYEGMLDLQYVAMSNDPSTLTMVNVFQGVAVRRSDHLVPYPAGFLGFVDYSEIPSYFRNRCEVRSNCSLYSEIVGNDPQEISFWKISERGKKQAIASCDRYLYKYRLGIECLIAGVSKSDAGRYLYRGSSHSGTVIEKEIEVVVTRPFVLLKEKSKILKQTPQKLILQCAGQGYPDPVIEFYNGTYSWEDIRMNEGPGISMESEREDDNVIVTTLTLDSNTKFTEQIYCTVKENNTEYPYDGFQIYDTTYSQD